MIAWAGFAVAGLRTASLICGVLLCVRVLQRRLDRWLASHARPR